MREEAEVQLPATNRKSQLTESDLPYGLLNDSVGMESLISRALYREWQKAGPEKKAEIANLAQRTGGLTPDLYDVSQSVGQLMPYLLSPVLPKGQKWFYKLDKALEKVPNKVTPSQLMSTITSQGVPSEEIQASGLSKFPAMHRNKPMKKSDVQKWIQLKRPKFEVLNLSSERVKRFNDRINKLTMKEDAQLSKNYDQYLDKLKKSGGKVHVLNTNTTGVITDYDRDTDTFTLRTDNGYIYVHRSEIPEIVELEKANDRVFREYHRKESKLVSSADAVTPKYEDVQWPAKEGYEETIVSTKRKGKTYEQVADYPLHYTNIYNKVFHTRGDIRFGQDKIPGWYMGEGQSDIHQAGFTRGYKNKGINTQKWTVKQKGFVPTLLPQKYREGLVSPDGEAVVLPGGRHIIKRDKDSPPIIYDTLIYDGSSSGEPVSRKEFDKILKAAKKHDVYRYWEVTEPPVPGRQLYKFRGSSKSDAEHRAKKIMLPPAPFTKTWSEQAIKLSIAKAIEKGLDRVYIPIGETVRERTHSQGTWKLYDNEYPNFAKKYAAKWGSKVYYDALEDGEKVLVIPINSKMRVDIIKHGQPVWGK